MKLFILLSNLLFINASFQKVIDLKNFEWNNRLICIEAKDKISAEKQVNSFKLLKAACEDRKIRFFVKIGDNYYQDVDLKPSAPILNFPSSTKSSNTSIFLIGLDGGIKYHWNHQIEPRNIFEKIDAMPMRIGETKNK